MKRKRGDSQTDTQTDRRKDTWTGMMPDLSFRCAQPRERRWE